MSDWTHALCFWCWNELYPSRVPHALVPGARRQEVCCRCGNPTRSGIYYRADPAVMEHCEGHDD